MEIQFGVVEIGSTNTKAYRCGIDSVSELGFKTITFKKNYNIHGEVILSDMEELAAFINDTYCFHEKIFVYATSVFREMSLKEINSFEEFLNLKTNMINFKVVSAEEENKYTVIGALSNVQIDENVCVFVGGGGSTEISICNKGRIIEMVNTNIGVNDVMKKFPDLSNDLSNTSIDNVTNYILHRLNLPIQKSKYMILAGGDFILRYSNAQYPVKRNTLFESDSHPFVISYDENRNFEDKYYHEISLNSLKKTTPENPKWWDATRAMCAFTNTVALSIGAKVIIPTKVSMIYGIVNDLRKKEI